MIRSKNGLVKVVLGMMVFSVSVIAQSTIQWSTTAADLRGRNGQQFSFVCPAGGTISGSIWGTDLYTDDSSICTAAVHRGLFSPGTGGNVTIEIRPGAGSYAATTRNGVTTRGYGSWGGSFAVISGKGIKPEDPQLQSINWSTTAVGLRGKNGQQFHYRCPASGATSGSIWGTDVYTDDTSICTAAVHAGLITPAAGGVITLEVRPGAASYRASTRNGVASRAYGGWQGSFVLMRYTKALPDPEIRDTSWSGNATALRGRNGQRISYRCPAGGTLGSVWGSDLYTDDSSICTAAVHKGLISRGGGGVVTIEIRPGAGSYQGTTRNGVASGAYGSWSGSYVFVTR